MSFNWSQIDPLRPALNGGGRDHYVDPPHHTGLKLAKKLTLPNQRIALWGPVGSGKSTELRVAARILAAHALPIVVPLDVELDLRHVPQEWELHGAIGRVVVAAAAAGGPALSASLSERLQKAGVVRHRGVRAPGLASRDLTRELLIEISRPRPVVLLVDGIEKPSPAIALETLRQLGDLASEVNALVVLSAALVTGPQAYEVLEEMGFHQAALRPVAVDAAFGEAAVEGKSFLKEVALRLLGADAHRFIGNLLAVAAMASGGVPRTFLQLLRDSHTAAALAGREVPTDADLVEAIGDHRSSLRRLLKDGDLEALRASRGTSGIEVPVERRTRLLAHGLMLEYDVGNGTDPVVLPHPLLGLEG